MIKVTVDEAILHIHPNAEYVMREADINQLTFLNPADLTVTQEQIDAAIIELTAIKEAEESAKATAKAALLDRLGITADEAKLLLG
jgi:hypothetical protein